MRKCAAMITDPAVHLVSGAPETVLPAGRRTVAGHTHQGPGYTTWREHGSDDWLLIHTVSGSGRVAGPDSHLLTTAGDAILLKPHVLHDYRTTPGEAHWEIAYAHFHPRSEWLPQLAWPQPVGGIGHIRTDGDVNRRVIAALRRCARMSIGILARADLFAVNALEEALLWYDTQNPLSTPTDERILRVIDYVDAHLTEPLDVPRLANVVHLSPSRLTHLFTEQLQISPQRYVERQRMALAQQLLQLTNSPIAEVAREIGITNPLYFSQRFHHLTGLSPTAYRQRHAGQKSTRITARRGVGLLTSR
jgi:AraC family transcriptional regulator, arabinose operon regulatory protein